MKQDLRVIKTEKAIKDAFGSLLATTSYYDISVKDICDKALINRNTFYLHYSSKGDLLNAIFIDVEHNFKEDSIHVLEKAKEITKDSLVLMFTSLIKFINQYKLAIKNLLVVGVGEQYINEFRESFKKFLPKFFTQAQLKSNDIYFEYMVDGLFGTIAKWIRTDEYETHKLINDTAKITYDLLSLI